MCRSFSIPYPTSRSDAVGLLWTSLLILPPLSLCLFVEIKEVFVEKILVLRTETAIFASKALPVNETLSYVCVVAKGFYMAETL